MIFTDFLPRGRTNDDKVEETMREFKRGSLRSGSGAKVSSRKQAIAIALKQAGKSKDVGASSTVNLPSLKATTGYNINAKDVQAGPPKPTVPKPPKPTPTPKSVSPPSKPPATAKPTVTTNPTPKKPPALSTPKAPQSPTKPPLHEAIVVKSTGLIKRASEALGRTSEAIERNTQRVTDTTRAYDALWPGFGRR